MHKLSKLRFDELVFRYGNNRAEEWKRVIEHYLLKGFSSSEATEQIMKIGFKFLDIIIIEVIKIEKESLLKEGALRENSYFDGVRNEIVTYSDQEHNLIQSKAVTVMKPVDNDIALNVRTIVSEHAAEIRQSIARMVGIMQEELLLEKGDKARSAGNQIGSDGTKKNMKKVFIVHGHNHHIKEQVAVFIKGLGLEPIILHEQPNKGRTIIEKFTDYAAVHFAVVLLTADDQCKAIDSAEQLKPRARQNVILELGYFLGKLGRAYVCALYENGVDIPTDYQGVLFLPIDNKGKWRDDIVRELRAVGFEIDN